MHDSLPYIFIAIGVVIILFLSYIAIRAIKSSQWQTTPGVLLKKGKKLVVSKDTRNRKVEWKTTQIDIEYEYEVNGEKYISKRATFSDMVNKPMSSLDELLNEYLTTSHIIVYYNPSKPSDSVLFPGVRIWNFTPMVSGVLFIATGVYLLSQ